jgi:hypothetical protein
MHRTRRSSFLRFLILTALGILQFACGGSSSETPMPLEPVPHVGADPREAEAVDTTEPKPSPAEREANSAAVEDKEAENEEAATLPLQEQGPAGTD